MKLIQTQSSGGYSIIAAVMLIGFLLVLTASTFNLVLQELQDGRGRENYMKAYAGAEGALELALMQIKEQGYGYTWSLINSQDLEYFWSGRKHGLMSYDIDSDTSAYSGALDVSGAPIPLQAFDTDIVPLFTLQWASAATVWIQSIDFDDTSGGDLIWNVIDAFWGLSWTGSFTDGGMRISSREFNASQEKFELVDKNVWDFIGVGNASYLMIFNPTSNPIIYELESNELFTRPKSVIYSTSEVWDYSQNLATTVDNSEFLWILKYSIYSWN